MVSPMSASFIAGLDRSALALNVLLEVIKTLRDLKLTTTNKSGKAMELINKLITFLILKAIDKMEDDDRKRMTVSTNFDKAIDIEMKEYKNSINKLIQQTSTNNTIKPNPNKNK